MYWCVFLLPLRLHIVSFIAHPLFELSWHQGVHNMCYVQFAYIVRKIPSVDCSWVYSYDGSVSESVSASHSLSGCTCHAPAFPPLPQGPLKQDTFVFKRKEANHSLFVVCKIREGNRATDRSIQLRSHDRLWWYNGNHTNRVSKEDVSGVGSRFLCLRWLHSWNFQSQDAVGTFWLSITTQ